MTLSGAASPALKDVLEEHLEELAFLSIQRRKLLFSPELSLRRFRKHEERMEAHLDGLRIGGGTSVELALQRLEGEPWQVYSAARVWIELGDPSPEAVIGRLQSLPEDLKPAWKEAFRRAPRPVTQCLFPASRLIDLPSEGQDVAVDACGWHGTVAAQSLPLLARSDRAPVRFSLARHLRDPSILQILLDDPEIGVRRAALWSMALVNPPLAIARCRRWVSGPEPDAFAILVLGLIGIDHDGELCAALYREGKCLLAALRALGALGSPRFVEILLQATERTDQAAAGGALAAYVEIVGEIPSPEKGSSTAGSGTSPARAHWGLASGRFTPGKRWLRGMPYPRDQRDDEGSMELFWREAVSSSGGGEEWLRQEVPDGFFSGLPCSEALPGE